MPILAAETNPAVKASAAEQTALEYDRQAITQRTIRDQSIRELRTSDPRKWTYATIAGAVGITEYQVKKALAGS